MSLFEILNAETLFPYLFIGCCVLGIICIVMLVLLIINMVNIRKMKRNYRIFMNGKTAENLEDSILEHFKEIDNLKSITDKHTSQIAAITEEMFSVYKKLGMVKYDAFNEMGGKLSFALAMLDKNNNGFVMNAMHSREGCYTYVKEIIKGESFITLADEEKQALDKAMGHDV